MLVTILAFLVSQHQPARPTLSVSLAPDGSLVAAYRNAGTVRADNWWDRRPAGHLFAADEKGPDADLLVKKPRL